MSIRPDALPILVVMWDELEQRLALEGIRIGIADFGGFRTEADTNQINAYKLADYNAYAAAERAAGRTPLPISGAWDDGKPRPIAPYGRSFHNYGAARDFTIVARPAGMSYAEAVRRVQDIAEQDVQFSSGRSFGDDMHLELPLALEEVAAWWADYQAASASTSSGGSSGSASMAGVLAAIALGVGVFTVIRYAHVLKSL